MHHCILLAENIMPFQQQQFLRRRAFQLAPTRTLLVVLFCMATVSAACTCDAFLSTTTTTSNLLTASLLNKKRACHDWRGGTPAPAAAAVLRLRGGGSSLNLSADALRLAETLAPKIGILTSSALYLSPAMAVVHAIQANDIGDLNPLPLVIMSFVSVSWLVYGLSARDVYVTLSNIAGAVASIGYVVGTLPLLNDNTRRRQLRSTQAIVMAGTAAVLGLWTTLGIVSAGAGTGAGAPNMAQITSSLGMFASMISIILSASPLFTIQQVVSTRNSSSILGPLTMTQVVNALLWSMYGLAIRNAFVYGPNLIGLGLGLAQLALKIAFPSKQ